MKKSLLLLLLQLLLLTENQQVQVQHNRESLEAQRVSCCSQGEGCKCQEAAL